MTDAYTTYYYELDADVDRQMFHAYDDAEALETLCALLELNIPIIMCYRESDNETGLPFVTIYESSKPESIPDAARKIT